MLNKSQERAVFSDSKHLLVLAGAGTGKTSVMVNRIANIIKLGVSPKKIIATTFTNKAGRELLSRLVSLIGDDAYQIYCGTFHKISSQILRLHGHLLGMQSNFQLLTDDDQRRIVKGYLKDVGSLEKPSVMVDRISQYKEIGKTRTDELFLKLFDFYEKTLHENNFLDYSDLIQKAVVLFNNFPDVVKDLCEHVLVDEYQDINGLQYQWIKGVSKESSLFCVGDEDQSIYAFRGANIKYIQSFQDDFPDSEIIKLEENYRSCSQILRGAVNVISKNKRKYEKNLIASNSDLVGYIKVNKVFNEFEEASFVAKKIMEYQLQNPDYSIGVLVRTNLQLMTIEHALVENNIPYELAAGRKFYDKKEILDLVSYLRAINSADDFLAFSRIINVPKRGMGDVKLNLLLSAMKSLNCGFEQALTVLIDQLPKNTAEKCKIFLMQIKKIRAAMSYSKPIEILDMVLDETNYIALEELKDQKHLNALKDQLKQADNLVEFLENLQFASSMEESKSVQVMTMHGSKGLEFDVVLAPGWEENLFPSVLAKSYEEIEEERRLAYVVITRAKRYLDVFYCCSRKLQGRYSNQIPSRFLFDL